MCKVQWSSLSVHHCWDQSATCFHIFQQLLLHFKYKICSLLDAWPIFPLRSINNIQIELHVQLINDMAIITSKLLLSITSFQLQTIRVLILHNISPLSDKITKTPSLQDFSEIFHSPTERDSHSCISIFLMLSTLLVFLPFILLAFSPCFFVTRVPVGALRSS